MSRLCLIAALLAAVAAPAFAQTTPPPTPTTGGKEPSSTLPSNVGPADTHTVWAPKLPTPALGEDSPPAAFIQAAQAAIAAGRLGEAQEAIERAESRALTRSVAPSKAGDASGQSLVRQLSEARQALGSGDKAAAVAKLAQALANPEAAAAGK